MSEERRRNPRYPVEVPVRLTVAGVAYQARLHDLCRDAALVEAERTWPLETEMALAMELPGTGGPMEVMGRVVRLANEGGRQGMALLFTQISPAAAARIDFFVAMQS